jgi:hypothetical protein
MCVVYPFSTITEIADTCGRIHRFKSSGQIAFDDSNKRLDPFPEAASRIHLETIDDQRETQYAYESKPSPMLLRVRGVPVFREHHNDVCAV